MGKALEWNQERDFLSGFYAVARKKEGEYDWDERNYMRLWNPWGAGIARKRKDKMSNIKDKFGALMNRSTEPSLVSIAGMAPYTSTTISEDTSHTNSPEQVRRCPKRKLYHIRKP